MRVRIVYDSSPGVEKWVVNRMAGKLRIDEQTMHESRHDALESAAELADEGDEIIYCSTDGTETILWSEDE